MPGKDTPPADRRKHAKPVKIDRRKVDATATRNRALGVLFDTLFFRSLGVALIFHEWVKPSLGFHAELVPFGFWSFFMPEALRGKDSWVAKMVRNRLGLRDTTDDK